MTTGHEGTLRYRRSERRAMGKALDQFALAYADQTARDHDSLVKAVKSGRVQAALGR